MNEIEVKCPKKNCEGYAIASVSYYEGNTEGPCYECNAQVEFHYSIDIQDVRVRKKDPLRLEMRIKKK